MGYPQKVVFETLAEQHRKEVVDILNYYISSTTAAFRDKTVDYSHFDCSLDEDSVYRGYAIKNGTNKVIGFCTLEPFKHIKTFKSTAEVMYFIDKDCLGKGIGTKAIEKLEQDARLMGISKLVADVTDDNQISIGFHKKNGFKEYGRLRNCWKKFGKDLGVVYFEKDI